MLENKYWRGFIGNYYGKKKQGLLFPVKEF